MVKARNTEAVGFRLVIPELDIHAGEKVALVGQSGCGKSTLLDMLAMVLRPSEAAVLRFTPRQAADIDIADLWVRRDLNRLSELRRQHIGYVLQTGGLLPFLSVRDNILLSRRLLSLPTDNFVVFLVNALGIHRQLDKLPGLLSAGERQRVAIARALAHRPSIVIADEPTASLDPVTAQRTMALFMELADEVDVTVILASHDWAEIDKLGLRKLRQKSIQKAGGKVTESVFSG